MHTVPLLTISANDTAAVLAFDGLAGIVMLYSAVLALRALRIWFSCGRLSKALWIFVSPWVAWRLGDIVFPVGAMATLWHLRTLRWRQSGDGPGDLPFATGTPVSRRDER